MAHTTHEPLHRDRHAASAIPRKPGQGLRLLGLVVLGALTVAAGTGMIAAAVAMAKNPALESQPEVRLSQEWKYEREAVSFDPMFRTQRDLEVRTRR